MRPEQEDALYRQLAWACGLIYVDLRTFRVSGGIIRKVPAEIARRRRWIPMIHNTRRVVLVVDDPFVALTLTPAEVAGELGIDAGREFGFALASPSAVDSVLEARYPS